jgi:hypothetical protein
MNVIANSWPSRMAPQAVPLSLTSSNLRTIVNRARQPRSPRNGAGSSLSSTNVEPLRV